MKRLYTPNETAAVLANFLAERFQSHKGPALIGLGGPGASGKSILARKITEHLPGSRILTLDDYRIPRSERPDDVRGSHPDAIKRDRLRQDLNRIRAGETFHKPTYESVGGVTVEEEEYGPARFHLIDGEMCELPEVLEAVDFLVLLEADWRTLLDRRMERDVKKRQYPRTKAVRTFLQSNLEDYPEFSPPMRERADLLLVSQPDTRIEIQEVSKEIEDQFARHLEVSRPELTGLGVPILTPFDAEGRIDEEAYLRHLGFLAEKGVRRILSVGTTGEFFSLTTAERRRLFLLTRENFDGFLIFQAGRGDLRSTIGEARFGQEAGADAIMSLPPYYFADAMIEGIARWFCELREAVEIPFLIYNFPKHTQNPMTPELLEAIPHDGMKDSSGDSRLLSHTPKYFTGSDRKILETYQGGGAGNISARANAAPELFAPMEEAWKSGNIEAAERIQGRINRLAGLIGSAGIISLLKQITDRRIDGYPSAVRPPLVEERMQDEVFRAVNDLETEASGSGD